MRVSIVGGLDRLEKEYIKTCEQLGYKARVFNKLSSKFEQSLRCSECVLLMIGLSSHKMADSAKKICKKHNIPFICVEKSSPAHLSCAMKEFMDCENCAMRTVCKRGNA